MTKPTVKGRSTNTVGAGDVPTVLARDLTDYDPNAELQRQAEAYELLKTAEGLPNLIARFQLETERALDGIRQEQRQQVVQLERKVAALQDEWGGVRDEVKALKVVIEDALHQMREGVKEAINAQREAVTHAQKASQSAAVFDKLEASRPDFRRMVSDQNQTLGKVRDQFTLLQEQVHGLSKRLDEFEVVADDYEETKGTVRGMDLIVKDLNAESKTRRRTGVER